MVSLNDVWNIKFEYWENLLENLYLLMILHFLLPSIQLLQFSSTRYEMKLKFTILL